jgi:O-antigen/teichoic acid export membrane protein
VGHVKGHLLTLRDGVIEAFGLMACRMVLVLAMHLVLAWRLGADAYGIVTYAIATGVVAALAAGGGLPSGTMRFLSEYVERQDWGRVRGIVGRTGCLVSATACGVGLAVGALGVALGRDTGMGASLVYAAVLVPLLAIGDWRGKATRGLNRVRASLVPQEVLLPGLVGVLCITFGVDTAGGAVLVYLVGAMSAEALGLCWLWRSLPAAAKSAAPIDETRLWVRTSLPMLFGALTLVALNRLDVILVGAVDGVAAAGLYGIAAQAATLCAFSLRVVGAVVPGLFGAAYHGGRLEELRTIAGRAVLWSAAGALPVFLVLVVGAEALLGVLGPRFVEASPLLRILAVGQVVNAATGPAGLILLMTGHEGLYGKIMGAGSITAAGLVSVGAVSLGARGAAVGSAAGVAVMNIALLLAAWKTVLGPHRPASGTSEEVGHVTV